MEPEFEPKHPGGRPTKRTPEITEQICEAISYGLTDEEVAAMVGIDDSTLTCWKKIPEFSGAIKKAVALRKLDRLKRIEKGEPGWQGTAWAMERLYPKEFSRPEVQLQYKVAEDAKQTGDSAQILDWLNGETATIKKLVHGWRDSHDQRG
jgi:hypothetical protein